MMNKEKRILCRFLLLPLLIFLGCAPAKTYLTQEEVERETATARKALAQFKENYSTDGLSAKSVILSFSKEDAPPNGPPELAVYHNLFKEGLGEGYQVLAIAIPQIRNRMMASLSGMMPSERERYAGALQSLVEATNGEKMIWIALSDT